MYTQVKIDIKTIDANVLFKTYVKNNKRHSLFNIARHKLNELFFHAKQKNVYAYLWLLRIKIKLSKLLDEMNSGIENFEEVLSSNYGKVDDFSFSTEQTRSFIFTNSIVFNLYDVLRKFDRLCCLIIVARRLDYFHNKKAFFSAKGKYRNLCLKTLGGIMRTKSHNLPSVFFDDYLNNTEAYRLVSKTLGEIDPQELYNAIQLMDIPFLGDEERVRVGDMLKGMIDF